MSTQGAAPMLRPVDAVEIAPGAVAEVRCRMTEEPVRPPWACAHSQPRASYASRGTPPVPDRAEPRGERDRAVAAMPRTPCSPPERSDQTGSSRPLGR